MSPEKFQEFQDRRDRFERSSEFQSLVMAIRVALSGIKDLKIAIDLEGTLVSNPFLLTGHPERGRHWLRRPFSNELLQILSDQNEVVIWTVANAEAAELILEQTQLKLPDPLEIIPVENTHFRMWQEDCQELRVHIAQIIQTGNYNSLVQPYHVKLPIWAGFDLLIDDQVENLHGDVAEKLGRSDRSRMVSIESYGYRDDTNGEFRTDPLDREWLMIAFSMLEFLSPTSELHS